MRSLVTRSILIAFLVLLKDVNSLLRQSTNVGLKVRNSKRNSATALFAEMRILIHGTKNAWTTLRPYDLILYQLEIKVKGKDRGLGVYTPEQEILPLCNYFAGSTEFYVDPLQESYSAEELKNENRLLRIVSADRRGTNCFVVEEYLDTDILIPIRDPQDLKDEPDALPLVAAVQSKSPSVQVATIAQTVADDADSIQTLTSKLEIANYDYQMMQLKGKRDIAVLQLQLDQLKSKQMGSLPAGLGESSPRGRVVPVVSSLAPKAVGPYSQATIANGFVFISGCVGMNMETGRIADGGVDAETRQALDNLKCIVEQSGSSMSKVCKTTVMIREMSYFAEVNKIYAEYFNLDSGAAALPARCTFEVSFLPLGAFIEIDAICVI